MKVLIHLGEHRGRVVQNTVFELVKKPSVGKFGPFLLVNGTGVPGWVDRNFKVLVRGPEDYTILDDTDGVIHGGLTNQEVAWGKGRPPIKVEIPDETDEQIKERFAERFQVLDQMVIAATLGTVKGLVVSGAPGTGKSYGVEKALNFNEDDVLDKLSFDPENPQPKKPKREPPKFIFVKGHISAAALYELLYNHRDPKEVVVFDDCDSVLFDDMSLNLLKTALDTTNKRVLTWATKSNRSDDLPPRFEYHGSVVFITNLDFEKIINEDRSRIAPHVKAIMSRCLYLDLTINSLRERMIRIEQVALDFGMLKNEGLDKDEVEEVMSFVREHGPRFRELSLRKVQHVATIRQMGSNWRRIAELTCLKE